jgi:hypothetical protein
MASLTEICYAKQPLGQQQQQQQQQKSVSDGRMTASKGGNVTVSPFNTTTTSITAAAPAAAAAQKKHTKQQLARKISTLSPWARAAFVPPLLQLKGYIHSANSPDMLMLPCAVCV